MTIYHKTQTDKSTPHDNTISELDATSVKDAIDELASPQCFVATKRVDGRIVSIEELARIDSVTQVYLLRGNE